MTGEKLEKLEKDKGIVVKFMIGHRLIHIIVMEYNIV